MKDLVVLGSLILVLYAIAGASGTQCYVGVGEDVQTYTVNNDCPASCYWVKSNRNVVSVGCAHTYMKDGCFTCPRKGTICFCNFKLCNRGKPARLFYESWQRRATNTRKLREEIIYQ